MKLTISSKKTLQAIIKKANSSCIDTVSVKMPSIASIHNLLNEMGIAHKYDGETTNVVEYRTAGRAYVNERHEGKKGKEIIINTPKGMNGNIVMDSSSSYYSWNTSRYADELIELFKILKLIK